MHNLERPSSWRIIHVSNTQSMQFAYGQHFTKKFHTKKIVYILSFLPFLRGVGVGWLKTPVQPSTFHLLAPSLGALIKQTHPCSTRTHAHMTTTTLVKRRQAKARDTCNSTSGLAVLIGVLNSTLDQFLVHLLTTRCRPSVCSAH